MSNLNINSNNNVKLNQQQFTTLSQIESYYKPRDIKKIYYDKQFNPEGIDYTNYIPMRFDSVNNLHIKQYYTINGWYILWYLMANSSNKIYIKINISTIMSDLNLSDNIVKKTLKHLQEIEIIKIHISEKNNIIKNINTILHISIGYYIDNVYKEFINKHNSKQINNGYRAIPTEYIKNIISSISPNQWAILSVLFIRYSWHTPNNSHDEITYEILEYNMKASYYAFPKIIDICNYIGIGKTTVLKELYEDSVRWKALTKNKYKILHKITKETYRNYNDTETYENRIKKENNRYYITLFERYEYIYYHVYLPDDKRNKEIINKINKYGYENISKTEEQYILTNKDFIEYEYNGNMKEYDKWVKDNNIKEYNFKCEDLRVST
ncbi:hypothetical protein [Clostridium sp.]|uniref:hypothetical protein n=1 Tax=Clostridium sp. TaxID=1506 RepID=UPI00261C0F24|nr:hypothetical protein [Clostridium sp.]